MSDDQGQPTILWVQEYNVKLSGSKIELRGRTLLEILGKVKQMCMFIWIAFFAGAMDQTCSMKKKNIALIEHELMRILESDVVVYSL